MILLYNPRSCFSKYRMPNSLLSLGSVLENKYSYEILDGNFLQKPLESLSALVRKENVQFLGVTVMPGPQLQEAIPLCKELKARFPLLTIIWGGYFPSNHTDVVVQADFIDYAIRGQGETTFPLLIDALVNKTSVEEVPNVSFKSSGSIVHTHRAALLHPDKMPALPYHKIDVQKYLGKTYLGNRTLSYHSSYGCPFECGFCAIVPIYEGRWVARSAVLMTDDIEKLIRSHGANAIEFHDNNFFAAENRMVEFSEEILRRGLTFSWWGEGRPDTLLQYSDATFALMKRAGLKMIFMGAESGDSATLSSMNKGGTQTGDTVVKIVQKFKRHGIVPECSFIFGTPSPNIDDNIERDLAFIRRLKKFNQQTEIIIYVYSPIPLDGASLYTAVTSSGFTYPATLEEWTQPEWATFDLRQNPLTPWLKQKHIRRIKGFDTVLNAKYPTNSDIKLTRLEKAVLQFAGTWRYRLKFYSMPYEIKILHKLFRYRQPEIEGF